MKKAIVFIAIVMIIFISSCTKQNTSQNHEYTPKWDKSLKYDIKIIDSKISLATKNDKQIINIKIIIENNANYEIDQLIIEPRFPRNIPQPVSWDCKSSDIKKLKPKEKFIFEYSSIYNINKANMIKIDKINKINMGIKYKIGSKTYVYQLNQM